MSISSIQLEAFLSTAREKNFSRAAKKLHITQSALSQRILNLEQQLGSVLFIREPSGIRITDLGLRLLRYGQLKESLEAEFMAELKSGEQGMLSGIIRIAGFSSVTKSILIPVIGRLAQQNPDLHFDVKSRELHDLPGMLESGQADFILTTRPIDKQGIENHSLGDEKYVLVESRVNKSRKHIYLDHDEDDTTTIEFFNIQKSAPKKFQRNYLDEIYMVIEGVIEGMGRSVLPIHLIENLKGIEIVNGYQPLRKPVYLSYYNQSKYTRIQQEVIKVIQEKVPGKLNKPVHM